MMRVGRAMRCRASRNRSVKRQDSSLRVYWSAPMSDIPDRPEKSAADVAYGVVKAAVSGIPVAGGPAAELLGLIFGPPLERRREQWLEQLGDAVKELQDRDAELTPEKLSQNEAFITTADDPRGWGAKHTINYPNWMMGSPSKVLEQSMPELAGQSGFYNQIVSDLEQRGLMTSGGLHTTMTVQGMFSPRTTPLGKQFLAFISR